MNRRKFIKQFSAGAVAPLALSGLPIQAMARPTPLARLAQSATNGKVLVLVQLHGGNDGLNTLVPVNDYDQYRNLRGRLGLANSGGRGVIPLDNSLALERQVALHPEMGPFKALYDQGLATIVQGVGYANTNGSHFRSRDIWYMGGSFDEYLPSGWLGRYLDGVYPDFPAAYPTEQVPDPPAIELGTGVSLAFHRENGIPMATSLQNPEAAVIGGGQGAVAPPNSLNGSLYTQELQWLLEVEEKANQYGQRIQDLWAQGRNSSVEYPTEYPLDVPPHLKVNELSPQLKGVARLLAAGIQTPVFLVRLSGFDTHSEQAVANNPSYGWHAILLHHLSTAIKAFMDDLQALGLADKVLVSTFSEFGRRALDNSSYGTDHGTTAPMFLFGKALKGGLIGTNPDLSPTGLAERFGNLNQQHDYRQVLSALLYDWLGADQAAIERTLFAPYMDIRVDLFGQFTGTEPNAFLAQRYRMDAIMPNPVKSTAVLGFYVNDRTHVHLALYNAQGKRVQTWVDKAMAPGQHSVRVDLSSLPTGPYVYTLRVRGLKISKRLLKA